MNPRELLVAGPTGPLMVQHYAATTIGPEYSAAADSAEPIVFIHPVNTGGAVWNEVVSGMKHDRPMVVPDLRGHGRSTKRGPFGVTDYADDVLAVMDHFGFERAHLVGGSIGGPVAVFLGGTRPERVASITSFGGSLSLHVEDGTLRGIQAILDSGIDALFQKLVPNALAPQYRTPALIAAAVAVARGVDRTPELVYEITRAAFSTDVSSFARKSRTPSLVVNGSEDGTCTVGDGQRLALALGVEPVVLDGVGHLPMLERPETVISLIETHLAAFRSSGDSRTSDSRSR